MWDAINDGTIYSCPSLLATFSVICFADLKKYKFTYLFAFPALHSDPAWRLLSHVGSPGTSDNGNQTYEEMIMRMTGQETAALVDAVQTWRYSVDDRQHGFFLVKKQRRQHFVQGEGPSTRGENFPKPPAPGTPDESLQYTWVVGSLASYETGFFDDIAMHNRFIAFVDPSTFANFPGWMLRNLLVLIRRRWKLDRAQILCYRDTQTRRDDARSIVLYLESGNRESAGPPIRTHLPDSTDMPRITGWERNSSGKVMSRVANLGEYMDPQR